MKKIAVFGSINLDYFVESRQLPDFGETVTGDHFFISFGGKGANQAVAAARLGGKVSLFGSIGSDEQKAVLIDHFKKENIDISHLNIVEGVPSGAAFIQLYNSENRIIIIPGANKHTNAAYAEEKLESLLEHDVFLFQMEVPVEALEYLIPILHRHGKTIILDPAPAQPICTELLDKVTYLTPNEHEFSIVDQGVNSLEEAIGKYPNKLIVTCGEKGVVYHDGIMAVTVPARKVEAVDTTGAGDTFTGAFTVAVAEGKPLADCITDGILASSLAVMKKGAQSGMPFKQDIKHIAGER